MKKRNAFTILLVSTIILCLVNIVSFSNILANSHTEVYRPSNQIDQTNTLEIWLVQDPVAIVGEEINMTYGVRNHYDAVTEVQLSLYDDELPISPIFQEIHYLAYLGEAEFNYTYTFSSEGTYPYLFEATANGADLYSELYHWGAYTGGTLYLTLQQDYITYTLTENVIDFSIRNHYPITKTVSLEVDIDNGTSKTRVYDTQVILTPYQKYLFNVSHTFDMSGFYTTIFNATEDDTSLSWFEYGYWEVLEVISEINPFPPVSLLIISVILVFYPRNKRKF